MSAFFLKFCYSPLCFSPFLLFLFLLIFFYTFFFFYYFFFFGLCRWLLHYHHLQVLSTTTQLYLIVFPCCLGQPSDAVAHQEMSQYSQWPVCFWVVRIFYYFFMFVFVFVFKCVQVNQRLYYAAEDAARS